MCKVLLVASLYFVGSSNSEDGGIERKHRDERRFIKDTVPTECTCGGMGGPERLDFGSAVEQGRGQV